MSRNSTGNPIDSGSMLDLEDNAKNLDQAVNASTETWVDRLGQTRRTLAGADQQAQVFIDELNGTLTASQGVLVGLNNSLSDFEQDSSDALIALGYEVPVAYASGIDLTRPSQTVKYNDDIYAPNLVSLPFTTSGTFEVANFRIVQGYTGTQDIYNLSGDGSKTVFTLPVEPVVSAAVQVFIGGEYQHQATYTVVGDELTFDAAPPVGVNNIEVLIQTIAPIGVANASAVRYRPLVGGATNLKDHLHVMDRSVAFSVDTIAALRSMPDMPPRVWVSGYHTKNDGAFGSNIFRWNPSSTAADNGGTIIKLDSVATGRYELQYDGAVSIKWFGVKGDGSDDSDAIQNANDFCRATGHPLVGEGSVFTITKTVTLDCSCDLSDMEVEADASLFSPAIRVGTAGTNLIWKLSIKTPKVTNTAHTAGDGWVGFDTSRGVSIDSIYDSIIYVPSAAGFGLGVDVGGVASGCGYNNITLISIRNNKINLRVGPKGVDGWSNANTYYIGRLRHDGAEGNGGVPYVGTKNLFLEQCNDNLLIKPTVEGSANVTEFSAHLKNANHNTLLQPRWENSANPTGSMKVKLESVNPFYCSGNTILGGWEFGSPLDFTFVGANCVYNTKIGTGRTDQSFSVQEPIGINNPSGNGANTAHIQGFSADVNPLGTGRSNTNYNYKIYATGLVGKRETDTNDRLQINWQTAALSFGDGTVAPDFKINRLGSLGMSVTSGWHPEVNNTYNLGASSYRWKDCYLVNAPNVSSDAKTKQQIRPLSEAEKAVAVKCKQLVRAYKLNSAVEEKGDGARIHFGVIAQDVKSAFESEGLCAEDYGLLCYDEWESSVDDDGVVVEAGSMYAIRYEELLVFLIATL